MLLCRAPSRVIPPPSSVARLPACLRGRKRCKRICPLAQEDKQDAYATLSRALSRYAAAHQRSIGFQPV